MKTILHKRGLEENIKIAQPSELVYTTNTEKLFYGGNGRNIEIAKISDMNTVSAVLLDHRNNKENPHGVTKSQVGLGNVDNTSDLNKPISTAVQAVLDKTLQTSVIKEEVDLNTLTKSGYYSLNYTGTNLSKPSANWGVLIVAGDVGTPFQFFFPDSAAGNQTAYRRSKSADVWSAWIELKLTDTIYTHPTTDGNLHVPATGTTNNNKVLKAGATAGTISWGTIAKSEVGLGSVQNYGIATEAEALAGTSTAKYMTPALVKAVVDAGVQEAKAYTDAKMVELKAELIELLGGETTPEA